ncbi:MAG TPA: FAD-dependent oxidoreductase [Thermoleophilaceae bacterium]
MTRARAQRAGALSAREARIFRAFCEALIPDGGHLPQAEGGDGVPVVEPVGEYLAHVPALMRALFKASLRALELSPFPRRFSRLPLERRAEHLESLESSRLSPFRDLFLVLKTLAALGYTRDAAVQEAVGSFTTCVTASGAAPERDAPPLDPAAMRAPDGVERCDVVVVGSGAGGASAARVLAERGLDVMVVESGEYHDASTYTTDPLEAIPQLYRDGGMTACEGRPVIPLPLGHCVGGTTVINSGTCFRTPDSVLTRWRSEFGIDWAGDLEAEFEAVERALAVRPVDADTAGRNAALCRVGAERLGASNAPLARNAGDVVCCGSCPVGCRLDAKQAMHVSELPRAVAAGARIRAGSRVERVIVEGGRAVGVACDGYEVRARAVVLAAGAIGTPELLMPQGLAATSGHLGRHLHIHPACWVGGLFDEEVRGWDGIMQSWLVNEWENRGVNLEATCTPLTFGGHWMRGAGQPYKERLERYANVAMIGVMISDRSEGRLTTIGGRARIRYRLDRADQEKLRFGIARAADVHFAAGASEVYPQVGRVAVLAPGEQDRRVEQARFRPGEFRLEGFHPMGTARMAAAPAAGVVAPSGEAHDVPGLYVADASVFPTALGVNPMITICAVARRIAAGLAERLS